MNLLIDIDVPDLEAGIAFYSAALGLRLARHLDGDVAELEGAESRIYLLEKPADSAAHPRGEGRRYDRHWTPIHVDFVVEDLEAATRRALLAGAVQESGRVDWRGSSCVTFSDPFGHGFCLIAFTADSYR